jgi:NTE family protein
MDMTLPAGAAASKPEPARPMPGQVVVAFQGGGALNAYQGGVYQALHEAGIEPDWVIGTSSGAINAGIIAGNPPEKRLDRLREFWTSMEYKPWWEDSPLFAPWLGNSRLFAELSNQAAHVQAFFGGVPGYYAPNHALALGGVNAPLGVERAALYTTEDARKDDDRADRSGVVQFRAAPPHRRDGQREDRAHALLGQRPHAARLNHVLASAALPISFPAVRIDGDPYWDGGIYSNTPIEIVFDDNPRRDSIVFADQMWHSSGPEPQTFLDVLSREKDIQFASRDASHIARQQAFIGSATSSASWSGWCRRTNATRPR